MTGPAKRRKIETGTGWKTQKVKTNRRPSEADGRSNYIAKKVQPAAAQQRPALGKPRAGRMNIASDEKRNRRRHAKKRAETRSQTAGRADRNPTGQPLGIGPSDREGPALAASRATPVG